MIKYRPTEQKINMIVMNPTNHRFLRFRKTLSVDPTLEMAFINIECQHTHTHRRTHINILPHFHVLYAHKSVQTDD